MSTEGPSKPPSSPRRAVVVGGGLAGLSAAESLRDGGWLVTLLEPSGRCGGVIETVSRDGWLVERSADSFLAARPEAVELVERLGLSGHLVGIRPEVRRALVCRGGRLHPVPAGFRLMAPGRTWSVLSTPLLSLRGRLRVVLERFVPRRRGENGGDDESLRDFAVRRLGREAFARLVHPLVSGIWTADPGRLSMAAACEEFLVMERRYGSLWAGEAARLSSGKAAANGLASGARYGQFVTLAEGMETLPARLAERLIDRGVAIRRVGAERLSRGDGGGWSVGTSDGGVIAADGVVVAAPAAVASRFVAAIDPPLADELAGIEYAGSAIVSLGFAREDVAHPLDAAGVVVPRAEGRRILAVSFSSSKFPGRAPEGMVLMRSFVGGALDPSAARLDDRELESIVMDDLRSLLGVRGSPRFMQIDRWAGAMPQYHLGHLDRLSRIDARLRGLPGLALAGAAYRGVGIPQVILSGRTAAALL